MQVSDSKIYTGVDLMKLLFAISVVYMHTYCHHDLGMSGDFALRIISSAAVPFFFICSGFFFKRGLNRNVDSGVANYFNKYISRILKMYLAWTVITLPVAFFIINRAYPSASIAFKALYWIRMFCLSGSIGIYWYLLALLISSFIIYLADKYNMVKLLILVSVFFFIWGELYNSRVNEGQICFEWIHVLFGSTRNFLNTGLFYMMIGCLFAEREQLIVPRLSTAFVFLVTSIVLRILEIMYLSTNITVVIVAMTSFLFALSLNLPLSAEVSLNIRRLSIGLYCIHFPFILLFDFSLHRGTVVDFPITLLVSFVLFFLLVQSLSPKQSDLLFGR